MAKRDTDPANDFSDGRYSGLKYVAKRLGLKVSELQRWLKRKKSA